MTRPPRPVSAPPPQPKAPLSVSALSVVFKTASYPPLRLDEPETEMILRVAADVLKVPASALLATPAPRALGEGDKGEYLFEVHLDTRFAAAALVRVNPSVQQVRMEGPSRSYKLPPADKRLRLPRGK